MSENEKIHTTVPDPTIESDIKKERFFLEGPRSRTKELLKKNIRL